MTSACTYGIRFLYNHGHSFCPYSLMRVSKVRAATCLSAPRSSRNLITERARSMILCSHACHWLIQFSASLAVRVSLRQSILHGLSRQHTAIGQKILFVILIVHGFPHLLFRLFTISYSQSPLNLGAYLCDVDIIPASKSMQLLCSFVQGCRCKLDSDNLCFINE